MRQIAALDALWVDPAYTDWRNGPFKRIFHINPASNPDVTAWLTDYAAHLKLIGPYGGRPWIMIDVEQGTPDATQIKHMIYLIGEVHKLVDALGGSPIGIYGNFDWICRPCMPALLKADLLFLDCYMRSTQTVAEWAYRAEQRLRMSSNLRGLGHLVPIFCPTMFTDQSDSLSMPGAVALKCIDHLYRIREKMIEDSGMLPHQKTNMPFPAFWAGAALKLPGKPLPWDEKAEWYLEIVRRAKL